MTQFNFGPIARTSAGSSHDTINLAPFPLHVMLNALVGSTSVEEFVAWLWHDLYKPAFYWIWDQDKNKFSWYHTPGGKGAFSHAEKIFAQRTNIREGLVKTHHWSEQHLALYESDFISDQVEQIDLGATVNYLQLSFAAEPALPTLLPRLVIANAFIEVVTKEVAGALRQAFLDDGRVPIEQVRFEFETSSSITFSSEPTESEIWQKVGKHFDVRMDGNTFIMRHLTPVSSAQPEPFATTFTADLMGKPLPPSDMLDNTLSLAELLVLYQDSRTVIIAVPQSQLYTFDVAKIQTATFETSRYQLELEQPFNVLTEKGGVDYLKAAFESQIEIREVPGRLRMRKDRKNSSRKLNEAVQRPVEMLTEAKNASDGRLCCLTGTWFQSSLPEKSLNSEVLFKKAFVDTEFVGLTATNAGQQRYLTPLAHLYAINSSGAGKGETTRKAFRGAFAYLVPASHFLSAEDSVEAVERPPLDFGGRFVNQLSRITVTTQEFTLFQQMSRRIIAKLWQRVANEQPLPLPYLGAIALTQEPEQRSLIKQLLPQLDLLFSEVILATYPFKIEVNPAIEIGLEVPVHDQKQHHAKHTLLKTAPHLVSVKPQAAIPLLIDDKVQVNLTKEFFMRANLLADIAATLKRRKKKVSQQDLWLKLILANRDPVTAVLESAAATLQTEGLPKTMSLDTVAFTDAEKFWNQHIRREDFAASWDWYEQLHQSAAAALEEFPALLLLLQMVTSTEK